MIDSLATVDTVVVVHEIGKSIENLWPLVLFCAFLVGGYHSSSRTHSGTVTIRKADTKGCAE